ncbi:MAG TPA: hypothetical protein VGS41_10340, partial [Chthonomonadales bacterium]|nr:hypothetical protein [Chthonomonadales bacterium]
GILPSSQTAQSSPVTTHEDGLHGYIAFATLPDARRSKYNAGIGFYSAVWELIDKPLAGFQIGLPGCWILPDNSDDKDRPLAPDGTLARTWKERGPTWDSVFQTIEGGLGYWAGNHFRYGCPKFSMNGTPQCYDYEVGSPGWSFFYSNSALPDYRLSIAQLSNRLLVPPDGLTFDSKRDGQFLGYAWLALPFTSPKMGAPPTGDQSWTCFLNAGNFKGPFAFYVPQTWSKIGALFKDPYLYGRGLDARSAVVGGGAIEINTVPRMEARDAAGRVYSRIPRLRFPTDRTGQAVLVQDVMYFSKSALYDSVRRWRDEGVACSGQFNPSGSWKPTLTTSPTQYGQANAPITGIESVCATRIFSGNRWGLQWFPNAVTRQGEFPEYFRRDGAKWTPVTAAAAPAETGLTAQSFRLAGKGADYITPDTRAWKVPGPASPARTVTLRDGSRVTYAWYRFIDQPVFQQYHWDESRKQRLQKLVSEIQARWTMAREYMPPPTSGSLVRLYPALIVTPPAGMKTGYVPIVIGQRASH